MDFATSSGALMTSDRADLLRLDAPGAHREAATRDPRSHGFGYLAKEPASGALASFVWFATPAELVEFLATVEVELLSFDEPDATRLSVSVRRVFRGSRAFATIDRKALTAAFEGWCEIAWLGTFAELCDRGGPFATQIRADFRKQCALGGHGLPVADEELDRFVAFLATGAVGRDER